MLSINRFQITGNIGSIAPFEKSLKINVATNRHWTQENSELKEATDWVQITVLDERQIAYLKENAKQGDVIQAEGRIANNSYQRNGETVYTTDLIASLVNLFGDK
ncbi:single-stranded DNA-binding protein [Brucella gallinifaecis]|uniref:Single-stranded DNA-binding protein n=1 Tax=Brucella gallinifaecis TaxID=215590 RepID=A0A502BJ37_9HYPH|nr:single-stranded DNA-binding protein [Brucella gallinifaecis]TPF73897.1 single-stranded DNA-binding protein [Brucella gallinifaecis]